MKGGNGASEASGITHSPLGEEYSRKVCEVRKVINWRGACGGSLQKSFSQDFPFAPLDRGCVRRQSWTSTDVSTHPGVKSTHEYTEYRVTEKNKQKTKIIVKHDYIKFK